MPKRMVALLADERAARDIDLLRALYDRGAVDIVPPHLPLVAPFEENTPLADLLDMVSIIVGVRQPFMLELGDAQRHWDGEAQLLQLVARQGGAEAQALADALYRDVFPHHRPDDPAGSPLRRTALTLGRFDTERGAEQAAAGMERKTYFLVVSQVGVLTADSEGGWTVTRTLELGRMPAIG